MNYISCTVRILENPIIKLSYNKIPLTKFKIEVAQIRDNQYNDIVNAIIWGDLAYQFVKYYQINDYLLIEGYFYSSFNLVSKYKKDITISILKFYPYLCLF